MANHIAHLTTHKPIAIKIRVKESQVETCGKCQHRANGTISALNSHTFDRKYRKRLKYTTP